MFEFDRTSLSSSPGRGICIVCLDHEEGEESEAVFEDEDDVVYLMFLSSETAKTAHGAIPLEPARGHHTPNG